MYVGIDIGATKTLLAVSAMPDNPTDLQSIKFPTPTAFPDFLEHLGAQILNLKLSNIKAAGVAVPGQIQAGVLRQTGRLPWHGLDINAQLEAILKAPTACENDATLGALSESRHGAGRNYASLLYVTLSTGIGTGLIIEGQIPPSLGGSEGGHMIIDSVNKKTFEDIASGSAFKERFGMEGHDVKDPQIWRDYGRLLAPGLYSLIVTMQPRCVVIGGSLGVYFEHYYDSLIECMEKLNNEYIALPEITAAAFSETAPVRGALLLAKDIVDA